MNTFRRFIPALMLGLTMSIAGAGFAQNASQSGDQKKVDSCCCCGDSCDMKTGSMKNHATTGDKHDCCRGDSCATKDGAKTGAADKHDCCCCGDSCPMMKKDGKQNHAGMSADKQDCCGGDGCNMKHDAAAGKNGCCCCGDSCDVPDLKRKDAKQKP